MVTLHSLENAMTKNLQIFFIIFIAAFFLMPSIAFACGVNSEKSCCSKEISSKKEDKKCCKENKHSQKKNTDNNCGGKCGHANCVSSGSQFNLALFYSKINLNYFDFNENRQNYYFNEINLSTGFHSIWLIPKIS